MDNQEKKGSKEPPNSTPKSVRGIGALDVDPNSVSYPNYQQLRVLKVSTTYKAIA